MSVLAVTGATSGIGRRVAELAASRGMDVIAVGRDATRLAELERALGRGSSVVRADLSDRGEVAALAETLVARGVTGLVHAAGQAEHRALCDVDPDVLRAHLELHVVAGFTLARAVAAGASGGSSCVFFSSTLAHRPARDTLAYAVAKGALEAMVRALAVELAPLHRVNGLVLGAVDTPMIRGARPDGLTGEERVAQLASLHALGRLVDVTEVASTALHVLDQRSMTGALVRVDAGLSLSP